MSAAPTPPFADEPARTAPETLLGLQYLRGLAATGVVVFHASQAAGRTFHAGAFGVDIFFVLSGFLMMRITGERSRPWPFMRDRLWRIVPLYWLASLTAFGFGLFGMFGSPSLQRAAASFAFLPWGPPAEAPFFFPVLSIGWTLNYEIFFYALFACALLLPLRARLPALTAFFLLIAVLGRIAPAGLPPLLFWSNPLILQFVAGAWAGALWRRGGRYRPGRGWALLLAAPIVWMVLQRPMPPIPLLFDSRLCLAIPALLLLLGTLEFERRPGGIARLPAARLLGDASYSIYLWHLFAIAAASRAVRMLELPPVILFPLGVAAGVTAGLLAYLIVERPLLAWRRNRRRPPD